LKNQTKRNTLDVTFDGAKDGRGYSLSDYYQNFELKIVIARIIG
jgi:hypothetical protein